MSFVLYYSPLSPPSRAVKTLLLLSKTPYQEKIVDLSKGEHKTAEYERINPN
jgi:glutathione S-transferase